MEQRIIDTCRNQRRKVELRFEEYTEEELVVTAQCVVDCAGAIARHLGRSRDDIISGRDVFSKRETELMLAALRKLQQQAAEKQFDCGDTAILALKAVVAGMYLGKLDPSPAVRQERDRELRLMRVILDSLLAHLPLRQSDRAIH